MSGNVRAVIHALNEHQAMCDASRDELMPAVNREYRAHDNAFELPHGASLPDGWTAVDGGLERGGGPLCMRVVPSETQLGGFDWQLNVYSWVEPATITVDSGTAKSVRIAKKQAFWSAYAWCASWLRSLSDDPELGL